MPAALLSASALLDNAGRLSTGGQVVAAALIAAVIFPLPWLIAGSVRRQHTAGMRRLLLLLSLMLLLAAAAFLLASYLSPLDGWWFENAGRLLLMLAMALATFGWWQAGRRPESPGDTVELYRAIRQLEHEVSERKRAEAALQQSQDQLRQLAVHQERVREDERKRIAREIHDELGQNLMALRIELSMLQSRIGDSQPAVAETARQAFRHIDASIAAVRSIVNNLRPAALDLGLFAAIEWQVSEFQRRTGIACDIVREGPEFELDDERATALFRIVQESLTNVARHAQASRVEIDLRCSGHMLAMKIADNGIGIYPGCRRKPNSFGLLGIGERITALGGRFSIEAGPGHGTVLSVAIPLAAEVESA